MITRQNQASSAPNLKISLISISHLLEILPWLLKLPPINQDPTRFKKLETSSSIFQSNFYRILKKYKGYSLYFTHGSNDNNKTPADYLVKFTIHSLRHSIKTSIFITELHVIWKYVKHI